MQVPEGVGPGHLDGPPDRLGYLQKDDFGARAIPSLRSPGPTAPAPRRASGLSPATVAETASARSTTLRRWRNPPGGRGAFGVAHAEPRAHVGPRRSRLISLMDEELPKPGLSTAQTRLDINAHLASRKPRGLTIMMSRNRVSFRRCWSPVTIASAPAARAHSRIRLSGSSSRTTFTDSLGLTKTAKPRMARAASRTRGAVHRNFRTKTPAISSMIGCEMKIRMTPARPRASTSSAVPAKFSAEM